MKHSHPSWWLLAGFAVCLTAQASPQSAPSAATPAQTDATAVDSKVAIDPRTGKLRPLTQEERRQLSEQSRGTAAKARRAEPPGTGKKGFVAPATETEAQAGQRRLPAGGVAQPVPESSMTDLMIVRGADGQLRMGHADDASKLPQAKEASDE
ncbi:post-PEP-CTERM-1 domain-containing protein [Pseudoxanthomonas beigongshangi]